MTKNIITSVKNPKVQLWKSLSKKSNRQKSNLYIAEGEKMVRHIISKGLVMRSLLVKQSRLDNFAPILEMVSSDVFVLQDHVFDAIAPSKSPQGILVIMPLSLQAKLEALGPLVLVLDELQDPGNVGTLIRSADAAGFTGVLLSDTSADIYSPKVLQSTMGSIYSLPIHVSFDLSKDLAKLKENLSYTIAGSSLGSPSFFDRKPLALPLALIVGNEGKGISREVLKECNYLFSLPMKGEAESLNAGVAGAIMMYDILQKEAKTLKYFNQPS